MLTWILPFAFVGVYPSSYFLHREEWYGYAFFTPVIGILFFGIAILLGNKGVKKYRGAGNK